MKSRNALAVGITVAAWSLGGLSAWAQRGGPTFTMDPDRTKELEGSIHELGPDAADVFRAWAVARIDGAEYFTKDQEDLRVQYQKLKVKIRKAVVEDRLQESAGRQYLVELLKIGKGAKDNPDTTAAALETLDASVQGAIVDKARAATLTPRLNRLQWLIGEIALYAKDTSALSNGKQSFVKRRLYSLEEKEESAKQDGKISDSERKRLMEAGIDIWEIVVKGLRDE